MGTRIFAVAGNPVLHSRSPQIMNCAFEALGIDAAYTRMLAGSGEEAVRTAKEIGIGGLNVTTPFKGEVIAHLERVSPEAEKLGAVNTIVFEGSEARGDNTDCLGAAGALENAGVGIGGKRAVVLGAGGAGKAAAFGLHSGGAEVVILNRNAEKAEEAAEKIGCRAGGMESLVEEVGEAEIVVSCLPFGVGVLEAGMLTEGSVVMDANYHGSVVGEIAENAGCKFIGGEEWLLAQAAPSFELFVGKKAPLDVMREAVRGECAEAESGRALEKNIALIGFMGAGKSAVASKLSSASGREAVSTDAEIERKAGRSIREIFAEEGEEGFRRMEREEIARVGEARGKIIDCGGGAVLDGGNVEVLRGSCIPVWLWARPETAVGRVGKDRGRPLLDVEGRVGAARKLSWGRRGKYAKTAEIVISTEERSAEEIAGMILHETSGAI